MRLRADRPDLFPESRGSSGVGFMGGLLARSMLHNDVTKDWAAFDDEIRKMRGTLFTGTDIAKIMMAQSERGVPLNEVVKNGEHKGQLLGGVIARRMLGIATATGEDPSKTFATRLAIGRGFEMPFSAFPHISDTIAGVHQKTGISLKNVSDGVIGLGDRHLKVRASCHFDGAAL